jgi:Flp pilus assembly protein TadG
MAFPLVSSIGSFRTDERGGVATMFGLMAIGLTMFAGAAIDYSRVNHERSRVAAALDSASLAASKELFDGSLNDADVQRRAQAFFDQSMKVAERFGTINSLDVQIDRANSGVTITATVSLPMTLTRLGGVNDFVFPVVASTSYEQQDIEL